MSHLNGRAELRKWANAASSSIRYAPDREQVYEELIGHMEDARSSFIEAGYSEDEAVSLALKQMGDPQEVADQMRMIYRPFWGYLYKYTRILGRIASIYLAICIASAAFTLIFGEHYDPNDYFRPIIEGRVVSNDYRPTTTVKSEGYTISVERVRFIRREQSEPYDEYSSAYFVLKVTHLNTWLKTPDFYRNMSAVDDLGNLYPPRVMWDDFDNREVSGNTAHGTLFTTYYEMWVANVAPDATVVTLQFDDYGVSWQIPMEVYGEGEYD